MTSPVTSPLDLFQLRLRTMLWVEVKLAEEVLPQLLEQARSSDLRRSLERHLAETEGHVGAVREVLRQLELPSEPEESPALRGLVEEHERLVKRIEQSGRLLLDLAHAEAVAATEHLEIASYDALVSMAEALGEEEIAIALRELLEQEQLALELVDRARTKLLAVESSRS